jgi:NADPH:quinone reductase-like Zn-dependent oxidoreductase
MRARTPEQKGRVAQAVLADVWPHLPAKKQIKPVIDSVYPLAKASDAHARMESNQAIGKIVLEVTGS